MQKPCAVFYAVSRAVLSVEMKNGSDAEIGAEMR